MTRFSRPVTLTRRSGQDAACGAFDRMDRPHCLCRTNFASLTTRNRGTDDALGFSATFLFFLICTGIATGSLARHRGRSFYPWFIFGALAWFVAIPWLLFTKSQLSDRAPPAGTVLLSSLAAACAAAVLVADLVLVPAKLPNCDYYSNISVLNKAVSGSSAGKAGGLEIITIKDVKEISRSKSDLRCTGTAQLNNSTAVAIDYRFFIEDGRLLGEAHWQ